VKETGHYGEKEKVFRQTSPKSKKKKSNELYLGVMKKKMKRKKGEGKEAQ